MFTIIDWPKDWSIYPGEENQFAAIDTGFSHPLLMRIMESGFHEEFSDGAIHDEHFPDCRQVERSEECPCEGECWCHQHCLVFEAS